MKKEFNFNAEPGNKEPAYRMGKAVGWLLLAVIAIFLLLIGIGAIALIKFLIAYMLVF